MVPIRAAAALILLLAGQAPGRITHARGRPFDDASGVRLREWLGRLDCNNSKQEYYLPKAVAGALNTGNARVTVLPTEGRWCGITSRADRTITEGVLRDLVEQGVYPEKLWE